jgi:hypothetical protein
MNEKKYSIFHIDGGIGKHIAATAVAKCIKNNYPDRELIVVCAWPSPFINLDYVDRVYRQGNTPYFYDDYIRNKDSLIFKHEPYFTTDHIHGQLPLIENWCKLYQLEYNNEQPELVFNLREKQIMQTAWSTDKPMLLLQTSGGLFDQHNASPYKWTRDMPIFVMNRIVKEFGGYYNIFAVTRPDAYTPEGMIRIDKQYSVMELMTIIPRSQKRLFIDSSLQHAAAALKMPSTVLWIGTNPDIFGYPLHNNIVANRKDSFKLPDSYLFDYSFDGIVHECPYKNDDEIFDIDKIIDSVSRHGF